MFNGLVTLLLDLYVHGNKSQSTQGDNFLTFEGTTLAPGSKLSTAAAIHLATSKFQVPIQCNSLGDYMRSMNCLR